MTLLGDIGQRAGSFLGRLILLSAMVALLLAGTAKEQDASAASHLDREAEQLGTVPFVHDPNRPVVVVTGSSTVRLWRTSAATFPQSQVVNTGFGGSTMADLLAHYQDLIARFQPDEVFIGSGDNDLAQGRAPADIVADATRIVQRIESDFPGAQIGIIAAKPSMKRWHLRAEYEQLNAGFSQLAADRSNVAYIDVWHRLLGWDGQLRPELYNADGLHLNARGYRIYAAAVAANEAFAN